MIRYYKLFNLLNIKGMKKTDLLNILSSKTVAKLSKGEYISGEVVEKICVYLKCQPSDIMEVYKEEQYTDENGELKTREILANQESVDILKKVLESQELLNMIAPMAKTAEEKETQKTVLDEFKKRMNGE